MVGLVGSVVFVVYATRHLGVLGYGRYSFVIVFVSYFSFLSELGLDWVIVRDVSTDKSRTAAYMAGAVFLRGCASLLAMILVWSSAILLLHKPELLPLMFIASGSLLASSLAGIFNGAFQAFERMEYVALIDIPYSMIRPAVGIVVLATGGDLVALFFSQLLVDILRMLGTLWVYATKVGKISVRWDGGFLSHLLKSALPLMLWRLLTLVEQRIYILFLLFFAGESAVGWYSAPYKLVDMVGLLTLAAADAFLPLLSRLFVESRERFIKVAEKVLRYIVIIFVPLALGISMLAQPLVLWLFGNQYINSAPVLQYLGWLTFLLPCRFLLGTMLLAMRDWNIGAVLQGLAAIIAVTAGLMFIPINQYVGAAHAFVLTEAVMTLVPLVYLGLRLKWQPIRSVSVGWLKLGVLWVFMALVLYAFKTVNVVFLVSANIAGYAVGLYLLGVVTADELSAVRQGLA